MTAEDYIRERLKVLEGLDQPAPTKSLTIFERASINELKDILNRIQSDNRTRAKRLIKLYADSVKLDHDDDHTYVCPILTEISSLSQEALRVTAGSDDYEELESELQNELSKAELEGESTKTPRMTSNNPSRTA